MLSRRVVQCSIRVRMCCRSCRSRPHLTNVPALVLHEDAEISLRLRSRYAASLSVDGQISIPLQLDDVIKVRRSTQVARFARVRSPEYFYQTLTKRLRRN